MVGLDELAGMAAQPLQRRPQIVYLLGAGLGLLGVVRLRRHAIPLVLVPPLCRTREGHGYVKTWAEAGIAEDQW
ncbi:hypothetical protein GCM10022419_120000 [Nonomuraea rosea]|uniref:Uncharacterized protein n=1 Tax=Nonomuraea rosea TaxID=638574 RepID=A0ABP6ZNU7_9ACTN